ncbi:hypothetical protein A2160_00880 [Candidatus Beckwithbacteria bacterium RBG_13_42_9]|uniref:M23ase beta-sheet core domain-containing protein n=1 Tax=Candidatus Beckwithbacteria bacterium RBG_13_42_9 TaxID=1797457 RepID=A0A1F5E384_9BACT|nr:MAG: hypothetical protein A2160_00880 [Candidatus Beckwithbacteria bacterium RBG_13_42_9]
MIQITSVKPLALSGIQSKWLEFFSLRRTVSGRSLAEQAKSKELKQSQLWLAAREITQEVNQLGLSLIRWLAWKFILGVFNLFHKIERAFIPNYEGSQPISYFLRLKFESKNVKRVLGANLAVLALATSVIQSSLPTLAVEPNSVEVLPQPQEVLTTETTFRQPVGGYISQGFHWYHPGVDIADNDNQIVYPVARGVVQSIEYSRFGYGNNIYIVHENDLVSHYAHLSVVKVRVGESVDKNTAIGHVGSTGWSTGPHLHLEVYDHGTAINPLAILPGYIQ